ncbi:MAG: fibronectin type III domain-containing protein [Methylobacter sp.]|nr:MAG: fibronectin type III domain-containing protein [Methylobacter sp.]
MARGDYQRAGGHKPNNTYVPALVNPPTIFIAPSEHTVSGGEIWMAVSCNDTNYGGCVIHASNDNSHYYIIGRMRSKSTHGVLTSALVSATGTDTAHTLSVDVHLSGGTIDGVSQTTIDTHDSLCYVGGEFLAYKDAALSSGIGYYNLSHLQRGLYGSTPGAVSGAPFVLCNEQLFKYRFNRNLAGSTIYLKFQGFNGVESGYQDLASITAYPFYVSSDGGIKALQSDITLLQEAIGALPGAPSNNPVPSGIQVINRVNSTREITLVWDAYSQGPLKANYLAVFFKPISTPGDVITSTDPSRLVSVHATSAVFSGLSPDVEYKFGIAAVKVVGSTVESTAIIQPTALPDWLVAPGSVDYTGKIGGIEVGTVLFDLNAAKDDINSILADGKLSPLEKNGIRKEWEGIVDEKSLLDAQADAYAITAKKTAYDNAYTELGNYLNNTTAPSWNAATIPQWINDTNITLLTTLPGATPAAAKTAYRAAWVTYYTARIALTQEIADRAKAIADVAQTAAATALSAASTAQTAANTANQDLATIAKDGILSKIEKKRVILDYNAILDEKADIDAKAADMGLAADALKTAYDDSIAHPSTGLTAYLATLTSPTAWNDVSDATGGATTIVGSTFRAKFKAVYTARQALLNAITAEAAKRAVWGDNITGKPGTVGGYATDFGTANFTGLITGSAGIDITGTARFTGLHRDADGVDAAAIMSNGGNGTINGGYGWINGTLNNGHGYFGAYWGLGAGGGVRGLAAGTGAGVLAQNVGPGPALRVEGPMEVTSGTKVVNLNADKLDDLSSPSYLNAELNLTANGYLTSFNLTNPSSPTVLGHITLAGIGAEAASSKGMAGGTCPLGLDIKIDPIYLPVSITGQLQYQGARDMSAALPAASSTNHGWYYITSVAGNGYNIGDWAVSNGASWDKVDNTDAISSFNGRTGAINLLASDIPNLDWSKISSGTPSTLGGYGITNALAEGNRLSEIAVAGSTAQATARANLGVPGKASNDTIAANWTFSGQQAFTYVGAAPFTVASTMLVINLNADRLDGQDGAYYLDCSNFTGTLAAARVPTLNQNTTGSSGSCTGNAGTVTNGVYTTDRNSNSGAGFVGVSVGYRIQFKDSSGQFISLLANNNSTSRTYNFPDLSGNVVIAASASTIGTAVTGTHTNIVKWVPYSESGVLLGYLPVYS